MLSARFFLRCLFLLSFIATAKMSGSRPSGEREARPDEACLTETLWREAYGSVPTGAKKVSIRDSSGGSDTVLLSERYCLSRNDREKKGSKEKKADSGESPLHSATQNVDGQNCESIKTKLLEYIQKNRNSEEVAKFNKKNSKAISNMNSDQEGCQVTLDAASDYLSENLSDKEEERIARSIRSGNYDSILNGTSSQGEEMAPEHSSPVRNVPPESLEPVSH